MAGTSRGYVLDHCLARTGSGHPTYVEIDFVSGVPVAIDGTAYSPATLLETLNHLAGENGVGRVDMVENRFVGMKSRGVYETPGGTVLHIAHRALESITLDREVMHIRDTLIPKYAQLVYNGFWFSPERTMLQAAIDEAQRDVTGTVRLKLYKEIVSWWAANRRARCIATTMSPLRLTRSTISMTPKGLFASTGCVSRSVLYEIKPVVFKK